LNIGHVRSAQENFDEALRYYNIAVEIINRYKGTKVFDWFDIYYKIGLAHYNLDNHDSALLNFA
jgi:tetratricopeptide (TPR) repeat protein